MSPKYCVICRQLYASRSSFKKHLQTKLHRGRARFAAMKRRLKQLAVVILILAVTVKLSYSLSDSGYVPAEVDEVKPPLELDNKSSSLIEIEWDLKTEIISGLRHEVGVKYTKYKNPEFDIGDVGLYAGDKEMRQGVSKDDESISTRGRVIE